METDAALVEKVAKGLYEADRDHEATWPLSDDDDGNRGDGAYVRVTPREVVEEYRQHARDALKVLPPLLARPVPMGGQHSIPNGVDTHERYFYQPDPATSATLATPSPATVDVGEAADAITALAQQFFPNEPRKFNADAADLAQAIHALVNDRIRSLSTALETANVKLAAIDKASRPGNEQFNDGVRAGCLTMYDLLRSWDALCKSHMDLSLDKATKRAEAAESALETEQAKVKGLEAALKPFATFAADFGPYGRDDEWCLAEAPSGKRLTMGDVRAAHRAATPLPPSRKEKE